VLTTLVAVLRLRRRFYAWDRRRLEAFQLRRARAQVRFAVAHSAYFRERWAGHDLDDPFSLPTTAKADMMSRLRDYLTVPLDVDAIVRFCEEAEQTRRFDRTFPGGYAVGMSSGTSGAKTIVVLSRAEQRRYGAVVSARNGVPPSVRPLRVLFVLRVNSPAYREIDRSALRLVYADLMTPIDRMVELVNGQDLNVLAGQPSLLRLLAREADAGRLGRIRAVVSYGEVLEPEAKKALAASFRCPVVEIYQCSEGFVASACREGRLHLNEDLTAVQTVPVRDPATGEDVHRLVITDLSRRTQPILRYELNDCVVLARGPCPCGSSLRVVDRVLGRHDDVLLVRSGGGYRQVFSDHVTRAVIRASEAVGEYQVVQRDPGQVLVRVVPRAGSAFEPMAEAVRASLVRMFEGYGGEVPRVEVLDEAPIPNPRSLKLIRVERHFPLEDGRAR
jgi:putative adenylate-forming enzyme